MNTKPVIKDVIDMQMLIEDLNYYTDEYNKGTPVISDKDWDEMYEILKQAEQDLGVIYTNSPTQNIHYFTSVNAIISATLPTPMLSLDKTKDIADIEKFKGNKDIVISAKLDGLSLKLVYLHGKLQQMTTRGNGVVGNDVTHLWKLFCNIPYEIPYKERFEIDGEAIITKENFKKFNGEYKHPRNLAAGTLNTLDSETVKDRTLNFVAWRVVTRLKDIKTYHAHLGYASFMGFDVVPYTFYDKVIAEQKSLEEIIENIKHVCEAIEYPIDGMVCTYDDLDYGESLGATGHHPRHSLAFKFYDEEYDTNLIDIEWSMGRTGVLTPIAYFDEVEIDGTSVCRASMHNIGVMWKLLGSAPYKGQSIKVAKMNQIIPQVVAANECNDVCDHTIYPPLVCPICGEKLALHDNGGIKTLWCENTECEGQSINKIDHYCSKKGLDIKGLSRKTIERFMDAEYLNNISDLYKLYLYNDKLVNLEGFGEKSIDNILKAIEKSRDCYVSNFIAALGIPLIGNSVAKEICKRVNTWEEFRILIDEGFDFTKWETFGEEKNAALHNFDYTEADKVVKYMYFKQEERNETAAGTSLSGVTFVVTGKLAYGSRDKFKALIEKHGGKVTDSVTAKTDWLVNNDINSSSSKNIKAQQLGKPIITEEEFFNLFDLK